MRYFTILPNYLASSKEKKNNNESRRTRKRRNEMVKYTLGYK